MQPPILTRHYHFAKTILSIYPVLSYETSQLWANLLMTEGYVDYIPWFGHGAPPPRSMSHLFSYSPGMSSPSYE
jgi:hypothetical protein